MTQVLLIHPPVAKPGEPPAGIARLHGFLNVYHISSHIIDANLESMLDMLEQPYNAEDRWTQHAFQNKAVNIHALRTGSAFKSIGHYNRIVGALNRLISRQGLMKNYRLSLADCTHERLSPARSQDLIQCAQQPDKNPFYTYYQSALMPAIENHAPDLIGISVNFLSQALSAFAMIGLIKSRFPQVRIALGGGLVTSWMQSPEWQNRFGGLVDYCVRGAGEPFFIHYFKIREPVKITECPSFDWTDMHRYLSPGCILPYNTSMGCYWKKCRFCPETAESNEYSTIPYRQVFEDLNFLSEKTRSSLIHFLDNALSPTLLTRWIDHAFGMPWYGYVRFTEHLLDLNFCLALKKSGCLMLKLGLESGDQSVLDQMQKGIVLNHVVKILANLKKAGIAAYIYLLFGTPYESESAAVRTMNFVIEHHDNIGFINPAIFNMPIISHETTRFTSRMFSDGDLSLYVNFDHPKGWNRLNVRHFLDRVFKRNPVIANILTRTPKIFTSNHAPFFIMK